MYNTGIFASEAWTFICLMASPVCTGPSGSCIALLLRGTRAMLCVVRGTFYSVPGVDGCQGIKPLALHLQYALCTTVSSQRLI